jgi:SGNH domain-containing protein
VARRVTSRVVAVGIAAVLVGVPAQGASSSATTSKPSLSQLQGDIAQSVSITQAPDPSTTSPPLLSLTEADASIAPRRGACFNFNASPVIPSNAAKICAYGKTTAKRTLLLTGDSQAGMWLPALNALGLSLGWKVVFLAKGVCGPWSNPNASTFVIFDAMTVADCNEFNANVAGWVARHRPSIVVLSGRGYPLGANINLNPDISTLESEMASEVAALQPGHSKLIVMGPIPRYVPPAVPYSPSDCLDGATQFTNCALAPTSVIPAVELAADVYGSSKHWFSLAKLNKLFCTPSECAIVVKDGQRMRLVFYDGAHINRYFSAWISTALAAILKPLMT